MLSFVTELGWGRAALQTFSKCLNSPPPMTQSSYDAFHYKYMEITKSVAEESIKQAAAEVIDEQDGIQDADE